MSWGLLKGTVDLRSTSIVFLKDVNKEIPISHIEFNWTISKICWQINNVTWDSIVFFMHKQKIFVVQNLKIFVNSVANNILFNILKEKQLFQ